MIELMGIYALWYREFKVFLRERSRVVASIINPVLWLLIFGGGLGANVAIKGVNYQAFIYPGILAQAVLFSSVFFGVYIVWDKKIDFLKEVLIAPVSRTSIFIGKVIGGTTDSLLQASILLLIGLLLSQGFIPGLHLTIYSSLLALAVLFITTIGFVSLGLILGSQMESMEGFQMIISFLVFPLFFLSGALFPIDNLPSWLTPFTFLNPLTYTVDALRNVILGISQFGLLYDIGMISVFSFIAILIGTYAFEKMKV
ncbi:MAG: ABC transporter permease [Candidatus Parcubacteria bacterium]|nr:ABC transporter permease [Candidatus Parcubacteria bacterium]